MSEPFLGEIRIVPFNFAPSWWARCNGQLLPLAQNTALFSLLGTQFGGNGQTTFALPNLQGRAPLHQGQGPGLSLREMGQTGGSAAVTLTQAQLPAHTHPVSATSAAADRANARDALPAVAADAAYGTAAPLQALAAAGVTPAGGGAPHPNMQPYLVLNFIIALSGIFPSRP
ncbi:MAG: tail fiber protein [Pseudoxanthomonas sp.]|nr:tail fiber protein [Pseudoxanthomonas sp.]